MNEIYSIIIFYIALGLIQGKRTGGPISWQVAGIILFALTLVKFHFAHCGYSTNRTNIQSAALLLSGICVATGQFLPDNNRRQRALEICAMVAYCSAWLLLGMDFLTLFVSWIVGRELYSVFPRYASYGSVFGDYKLEWTFYRVVIALCVFVAWLTFGAHFRFDFYDLIRLK